MGTVAETAVALGKVLFTERPFMAAQAQRTMYEEHLVQQPLFCVECFSFTGPLEAALALATGHISRADLLDAARSTGGDRLALLRWLDFATKTPALPSSSQFSSEGIFVDIPQVTQPRTQSFFCSASCLQAWLQQTCAMPALRGEGDSWKRISEHAEASGHECVLMMAARAVVRAAATRPAGPRGMAAALAPLLRLVPTQREARKASVPQRALARAHRLLADMLVQAHLAEAGGLGQRRRLVARRDTRERVLRMLPRALHARTVAALDLYGWALDGAALPSALGQYCEVMCRRGVPKAQQAEMLASMGPAVKTLCEQQERLDSEGEAEEEEEDSQCGGAGGAPPDPWAALPAPRLALGMKPVVLPRLLTSKDIAHVKKLSQELAARESQKHATTSQWRTRYLHAEGAFRRMAPGLLARLIEGAKRADTQSGGWGLLRNLADKDKLRPRCVEHHLVSPGGALPDPTHYDGGSLLTVDVMLARPGEDFEGGEFCTREADGSATRHAFGLGDALVFVSHKQHHVQPVRSGMRETLIVELWVGEERTCNHRCERHWGACAFEARAGGPEAKADRSSAALGLKPSRSALAAMARDASSAFAPTAFEGQAFFARAAAIMAQSSKARQHGALPNVEIVFEHSTPIATVRAVRTIKKGEVLTASTYGEESEEDSVGSESEA